MNEFYETVANFLEEIRCDSEERKYAVAPEDMKESVAEMKKMQKKFTNATVTATPAQILRRQKQLWQGRWKYSLLEMPCISAKS